MRKVTLKMNEQEKYENIKSLVEHGANPHIPFLMQSKCIPELLHKGIQREIRSSEQFYQIGV